MAPIYRGLTRYIFTLCLASAAYAQDRPPDQPTPKAETVVPATGTLLTGKERTGRKWMDEQRIDNCNVPIDKRGSKPRPSSCLHSPSG